MEKHESPNPTFGKLLLVDWIMLIYVHLRLLIWDFPFHLMTYPFVSKAEKTSSLGTSFYFLYIRKTSDILTCRCTRFMCRLPRPNTSGVLDSPRYRASRDNLYQRISRPGLSGYWIIQSSFSHPASPPNSDVTIFYLHGGGYCAQEPASYLVLLLRLAESLLAHGLTVSIFALEYHLAPEHPFPAQLQDALVAYRYLLDDVAVPAGKIVIAGDSAGGHLALSLAVHLQMPYDVLEAEELKPRMAKPAGLVLLSPCLSFHSRPYSGVKNAYKDTLSTSFITTVTQRFLGPAPSVDTIKLPYLEFLDPKPAVDWDAVLPAWTWVFSGRDEIMVDDHLRWVGMMQEKLRKERVSAEFGEGREHVWQWMDTLDEPKKMKFLNQKLSTGGFESTKRLGDVIAERLKANKS